MSLLWLSSLEIQGHSFCLGQAAGGKEESYDQGTVWLEVNLRSELARTSQGT